MCVDGHDLTPQAFRPPGETITLQEATNTVFVEGN
jgi:hypothetical protein